MVRFRKNIVKLSKSFLSCCSAVLFNSSLTRVMTKLCPQALSAAKQADVTPLSDANEPQLISKPLLIRGRGREIARRAVRRDSPPQRNCFPWRWRSLLLFPTKTSRRRAESRGNTRETNKLTIRLQIGFSSLIRVFFFLGFFSVLRALS